MSAFLGIGLGPIQSGIFLSGAENNFDTLAIVEADKKLVKNVRNTNGQITINIAAKDRVYQRQICGVQIFDPSDKFDIEKLVHFAAEADEISTALPKVDFYDRILPWLKNAFELNPDKRRLIYTAENHNHAAEILQEKIGQQFKNTYCLNTVIGKMSGIVPASEAKERNLVLLTPDSDRAHLVEEFNNILISKCPHIENRKTSGLYVKEHLLPFEEAKLYGHNAVHLLLGLYASMRNLSYMHELSSHPDIIEIGRKAFLEESGRALLKKWKDEKDFFDEKSFRNYAEDLIERMQNPFLMDSVARVCRDLSRKLSWNDRLIGTIRLCISQNIQPTEFAKIAKAAAKIHFNANNCCEIRNALLNLWHEADKNEAKFIAENIISQNSI